METYTEATVTFSDGSTRKFSKAVVRDDFSLLATVRCEFTPDAPKGADQAGLKWRGGPAVIDETTLLNPYAWRSISQPAKLVLCALVHDPRQPDEKTYLVKVEDNVGHDFNVSARIDAWLKDHIESWGSLHVVDPRSGDSGRASRHVPGDRAAALAAHYEIVDAMTPASRRENGRVEFWLASVPKADFGITSTP